MKILKQACLLSGLYLLPLSASALNPSAEDRARGFSDNSADKSVTFIFDNTLWKISNLSKVEVRGSFNGWGSDPKFQMSYDSEGNVWTVTVSYPDVKIPGNSGQPEFKFVTNGSSYQDGGSRSFIPEGYIFKNGDRNNIVVFDDDDFDTIKANSATANQVKSVSDFDLTTRAGQEEVSNFRLVPGTSALFRSYHPYKITKTSNPTEPVRMDYLTRLAVEEGIKSDICLSEKEESNLQAFTIAGAKYTETIAPYYREIIDKGQVLYVGKANGSTPSYNEVYYNSTGNKFAAWVQEIVSFITSSRSEAPYLIHCRLGTDRTGMFCGVLAALCGASWDEIAADYQLSNRMGIQEFRDYHLLQYSFQKLLGVEDIAQVSDVSSAVTEYFVSKGILTPEEITLLKEKIGAETSGILIVEANQAVTVATEIYTIDGMRVSAHDLQPGLYIRRTVGSDGSSRTEKLIIR